MTLIKLQHPIIDMFPRPTRQVFLPIWMAGLMKCEFRGIVFLVFLIFPFFVSAVSKPVARIPFVFSDSRIIVHLKINNSNKELKMLFDTGADGVGLKNGTATEISLIENRKQNTQVVGATMEIGISEHNTLVFDSLKIPNQNIGIFPNHRDSLDGLFGSAFLRNFITFIDFENSVIELYPFSRMTYPEGYDQIPLLFSGSLPELSAEIMLNSGKKLNAKLFFDTGASYSMILFGASVEKNQLEKDFRVQSRSTTVSMGRSTPTVSGLFESMELGKWRLEDFMGTLQTFTENAKAFREEADGSLGIEVIRKFNWYIDLMNRRFYLKPNRFYNDLMPFWLGNVLLSTSGDRFKIAALTPLNPGENSELSAGDYIESMNDIPAAEFIRSKKPEELEKILKETGIEMVVSRGDSQFLYTMTRK